MAKFTELEKGTIIKNGKEYDYAIELADDFPKTTGNNIRIRILEERPVIRKIRTRYDPDIFMEGDADASMELILGYDVNELRKSFRRFLAALITPVYITGITILFLNLDNIPVIQMPQWASITTIIIGSAALLFLGYKLIKSYVKFVMMFFAEYLKARDIKKTLDKEGFKMDQQG